MSHISGKGYFRLQFEVKQINNDLLAYTNKQVDEDDRPEHYPIFSDGVLGVEYVAQKRRRFRDSVGFVGERRVFLVVVELEAALRRGLGRIAHLTDFV